MTVTTMFLLTLVGWAVIMWFLEWQDYKDAKRGMEEKEKWASTTRRLAVPTNCQETNIKPPITENRVIIKISANSVKPKVPVTRKPKLAMDVPTPEKHEEPKREFDHISASEYLPRVGSYINEAFVHCRPLSG